MGPSPSPVVSSFPLVREGRDADKWRLATCISGPKPTYRSRSYPHLPCLAAATRQCGLQRCGRVVCTVAPGRTQCSTLVQLGKTTVNWNQKNIAFSVPRSGDGGCRVFTRCFLQNGNGANGARPTDARLPDRDDAAQAFRDGRRSLEPPIRPAAPLLRCGDKPACSPPSPSFP